MSFSQKFPNNQNNNPPGFSGGYIDGFIPQGNLVVGDNKKLYDSGKKASNIEMKDQKGEPLGYAELDAGGKVPASQLPSYVDDVLEFSDLASFPVVGESGKVYISIADNKTYRWTGHTYVMIGSDLALGETSSTAYRGDRGKTAYDHTKVTDGNPHNVTKHDLGLEHVDNTSDLNKPMSIAVQNALNALTKDNVGLENVDNTSDLNKPISNAVQSALNNKVESSYVLDQINTAIGSLASVAATGDYNDLNNKLTAGQIKTLYENNSDTNAFTDSEKSKLASLESSRFLGVYTNLTALQNAHPNPIIGSYAYIDPGVGSDSIMYIWDNDDEKRIEQVVSVADTPATIKSKYESNPDTNAFTDSEKSKLSGVEAGAQVNTITSVAGKTGDVTLNKSDVGLGNVDNTSDLNKPISNATQTALNNKLEASNIANFETTTQLNARDTANRDRTNHTGTQPASTITGLSAVATSGSYNDLINKPIFSDVAFSGNYSDLTGTPTLSAVALSNSYNDLTDKPSIGGIEKQAGESISAGDVVRYGFYLPGDTINVAGTSNQSFASNTTSSNRIGQTFTTNGGILKSIRLRILRVGHGTIHNSLFTRLQIRSLDGSVLLFESSNSVHNTPLSTSYQDVTYNFDNFLNTGQYMFLLVYDVPNETYNNTSNHLMLQKNTSNPYAGGVLIKRNSSLVYTEFPGEDLNFLLTVDEIGDPTELPNKLYKASAEERHWTNYLGFAGNEATVDDDVTIDMTYSDKLSGLTPNTDYYLSNTAGLISTSPGSVNRKVGRSVSSTEMLINLFN